LERMLTTNYTQYLQDHPIGKGRPVIPSLLPLRDVPTQKPAAEVAKDLRAQMRAQVPFGEIDAFRIVLARTLENEAETQQMLENTIDALQP